MLRVSDTLQSVIIRDGRVSLRPRGRAPRLLVLFFRPDHSHTISPARLSQLCLKYRLSTLDTIQKIGVWEWVVIYGCRGTKQK